MEPSISPPPSKRRKLTSPLPGRPLSALRVFSWNINGIQPFIPASRAPITAYFRPVPSPTPKPSSPKTTATLPSASPSASLRAFLARHNWPHILFLQELKIASSDTRTPSTLLSALNTPLSPHDNATSPYTTYTLHTTLPSDKYNARAAAGKLYGVGTLIRCDLVSSHLSRVRTVAWDREGRVSIVEVEACREQPEEGGGDEEASGGKVALVNVYAVNGTDAAYLDPLTGAVAGTRHDRKRAFHSLLRDECLALEARGFDVVVAGDVNVARGALDGHARLRTWPAQHCTNRADFNAKFFSGEKRGDEEKKEEAEAEAEERNKEPEERKTFAGVDVWRAMRGDERRYTYYPRGREWGSSCDRVDMVIVSRRLWQRGGVLDVDILDTPQERGPSDHVPIYVEVKAPR